MSFDLDKLIRPNIARLRPYSSARSEFEGEAEVFLDANENAFGSPAGSGYNRYPDPMQNELKSRIAEMQIVATENIFVGNGSDEAIDLLFRIFCEPGRDECIICPPTYGMYQVSAEINDAIVREVRLNAEFQLDVEAVFASISPATKLIFICSPNNPTGNVMKRQDILRITKSFAGIVVVDEAYIDFAGEPSMTNELLTHPNLVILQTFSKAWGMAGLRVGMAFAGARIIELLNRVKPPYNVSGIAQQAVIDALRDGAQIRSWVITILSERDQLREAIGRLPMVETIYPSDANFLLVKVARTGDVYRDLIGEKIVVRDRSSVVLCDDCLRITVGTPEENDRLVAALNNIDRTRSADEMLPLILGGL